MLRILTKHKLNTKIVSVDIQDIVGIEGVQIIKGDITKQVTINKILNAFSDKKLELIICDGAPDVTGSIDIDTYMQNQLLTYALIICLKLLKKDGKFVAKLFLEKGETDYYYEKLKCLFAYVHYYKPSSSRNSSHEIFVICEGYMIEPEVQKIIESLNIENLINYSTILHEKTKNFLQFLIDSDYN